MDLQQYNIFPSFRPHQEDTIKRAIDFIYNSNKRYLCIQAPTGSGKSIVAYVLANYLADEHRKISESFDEKNIDFNKQMFLYKKSIESAYILTSKNLLLEQYFNDFNKTMPIAKGRNNYRCKLDGKSCAEGICLTSKNKNMECKARCPYLIAKRRMLEAKVSSTNFSLMLKMIPQPSYSPRDLVIVDECQALESVLLEEYSISFTENMLKQINDFLGDMEEHSNFNEDINNVYSVASHLYKKQFSDFKRISLYKLNLKDKNEVDCFLQTLATKLNKFQNILETSLDFIISKKYDGDEVSASYDSNIKEAVTLGDKFKHLASKICQYLKMKDSLDWVIQPHYTTVGKKITGFDVKPVTLGSLAEGLFQKLANKKVIFMSATIGSPKRFAKNLGINENDVDFIDIPSTFPVENRPFIIYPVAYLNKANMQESMKSISEACDILFEGHANQKGIVHTVSYENALYLRDNSIFRNRLLIHDQKNKELVLQEFKESNDKILLSPSIIEGFDFKGKLSEFQIFIKVPYLSLGDMVVSKRSKLDPEWYANNAILQILQGTGRSIRSAEDCAETWFLDGNINNLLKNYDYLFTKDFLSTIQRIPNAARK